ncbi:DoxX family protein [Pedobacter nutrimenti]|jgi:FtsH-binding integral membrane protein|uniref:DoxX-like protein n=1 Tax=Pedobacter nutrimenti TaxID=1241337 RepID=A0A318UPL2_9SPHI|nr:DoxX family protein [Pedobacter nutrimenti]PYF72648.1 DoxX-like protein [Pedobacter nutrimenti]
MNLKSVKITYWASTVLLALFILPGIFFINSPMAQEGTKHLQLPHWFSMEVGIGCFIGGLILIVPGLPVRIKEWAYVALGIVYVSALIAHLSVDGLVPMSFMPLVVFAVLLVSYVSYHKIIGQQK